MPRRRTCRRRRFHARRRTMAEKKVRITYATMSADNQELHEAYEKGVETARSWLGEKHPFYVNGEERWGEGLDEERSPIDRDIVIGQFARATRDDARDAIAAAKAYFRQWSGMPWQDRMIITRPGQGIPDHRRKEAAAVTVED